MPRTNDARRGSERHGREPMPSGNGLQRTVFLVCCLWIIQGTNGTTCSVVSPSALTGTITDTYTCCYRFQNASALFAPPVIGGSDQLINPNDPIVMYNGSAITQGCNGNTFYYSTGDGVYTSTYTGSDGVSRTGITIYYATSTFDVNAEGLQTWQTTLIDILTGRDGLLFITCNNGVLSCLALDFTGTINETASLPQANPTQVGYNGTTTGCYANSTTTFLTAAVAQYSVTSPNATITYNAATEQIVVTATGIYLPEFATYVLRFSPFNITGDQINRPTNCENRVNTTFTGLTFTNWWTHAPNAIQTGALNTLAYPEYGPSGGWTQTAIDCAIVQWTRSFPLSTLAGCLSTSGTQEVTVTDASLTGGVITYSGALYISLVSPIFSGYGSGTEVGYTDVVWSFPFTFTFLSSTAATTLVTSGGDFFTVTVLSISIISSGPSAGDMFVELQTSYFPTYYGYAANNTLIATTGATLVETGTPTPIIQTTPAIQQFTWVSTSVQTSYNGLYTFQWYAYSCPGPTNLTACTLSGVYTAQIVIYLSNEANQGLRTSFGSEITIFTDSTFTVPQSSAFQAGVPICFLDTLEVALQDANSFLLTITNAFLCGPNNSSGGLAYDGVTNFGCRNSSVVAQIVVGGLTTSGAIGTALYGYYGPSLHSLTTPSTAGLCCNAQPYIMTNPTTGTLVAASFQYVQIEGTVSTIGQVGAHLVKRTRPFVSVARSILPPSDSSSEDSGGSDTVATNNFRVNQQNVTTTTTTTTATASSTATSTSSSSSSSSATSSTSSSSSHSTTTSGSGSSDHDDNVHADRGNEADDERGRYDHGRDSCQAWSGWWAATILVAFVVGCLVTYLTLEFSQSRRESYGQTKKMDAMISASGSHMHRDAPQHQHQPQPLYPPLNLGIN